MRHDGDAGMGIGIEVTMHEENVLISGSVSIRAVRIDPIFTVVFPIQRLLARITVNRDICNQEESPSAIAILQHHDLKGIDLGSSGYPDIWSNVLICCYAFVLYKKFRLCVCVCVCVCVGGGGGGGGGGGKNAYELLNLRALQISMLYKNHIFQCMGKDILCGISKGTFEIAHKISCPYI